MSNNKWVSNLLNSAALVAMLAPPAALFSSTAVMAQEDVLDEIFVTARRRPETLLEIPISVSAFDQSQILAAGVTDLDNLSDYTPGFTFQNSDGQAGGRSNSAVQFRGIAQQLTTAASRTGAVFWDGSYISQGIGFIPLIDVERVEIIKGPQNAFFARNTFSGAVNYVPKEPGDEFEGNVEFETGFGTGSDEQASYRGVVRVGGPVTDTVGVRVAATYERKGADYEYLNGDPNGQEDNFAFFGTTTWDVTETFRLKASGFFADAEDTSNAQSVNSTVAPGDCNRVFDGNSINAVTGVLTPFSTDLSQSTQTLFCGVIPDASVFEASATSEVPNPTPNPDMGEFTELFPDQLGNKYRAWRANVDFEWELGTGHTIQGLASRGAAALGGLQDVTFGETGDTTSPSTFIFPAPLQNWTQDTFFEVRVASAQEGRLRYEFGVSYYEQEFRNGNLFASDWQDNQAFGIFGTIDYDITEELTLSAEGRFVDDKQTLVYVGAPGVAAGNLSPSATVDTSNSYNDFMPRVILSYTPTDDLNIYASWSMSSLNAVATNATIFSEQTADLNLLPDPAAVGDFTPIQELTSYEIGVKQRVNSWLRYSVAFFYMDWENQPFTNTVLLQPFGTAQLNLAGDSKYKGIDFEVYATPIEGLEFVGSVGWVDAELVELGSAGSVATNVLCPTSAAFTNGPVCSAFADTGTISGGGNRPRNVSEWQSAVSVTYTFPVMEHEFYVRGDAIYQGGRFIDNFAYNSIAGNWRANLRAGGNFTDFLRGEIFVENLTQNDTLQSAGTTGFGFGAANTGRKAFGILPEKREIGFRIFADF